MPARGDRQLMSVRPVGVIPAAGHARRLQPLAHSKEVHPVGGRPVMDYIMERMTAAGAVDLRIVTRPEKEDVRRRARALGAKVILGYPSNASRSFAMGLEGLPSEAIVLMGFPDSVWQPVDGFVPLVEAVEVGGGGALGLFYAREPRRSDVVSLLDSGEVTGVAVKPRTPPSTWLWGCAAARAGFLHGLDAFDEPGRFFDALCRRTTVTGIRLSTEWLDIGTK